MINEEVKRLSPTLATLRSLFAKSGNNCAFPECQEVIVDDDNYLGNVCHIEDAKPGGRFNEMMNNEERRHVKNLVLFCLKHHIITDNVKKFPVEELKKIKADHEASVKKKFEVKESVIQKVYFDLLNEIKKDTTQLLIYAEENQKLHQQTQALISKALPTDTKKSKFIDKIDSIAELIEIKGHQSALKLYEKLKKESWHDFNDYEKYKLTANIGICHLYLGEEDKGAKFLINALKFNPDDEKALGLAALGYAIKDKKKKAISVINKTISINSTNSNAYTALIAINRGVISLEEMVEKIPSELIDNSQISFALGVFAQHEQKIDSALSWLQNAVDFDTKNNPELKAALASTIIQSITSPFQVISGQVDNKTRIKVNYCIELFSEAWELYKDTDLRRSRAWILVNRGIAKKFIKDFDEAFEDIKQATNINDQDPFILRHLAISSFEVEKLEETLITLDKLEALESADNEIDFSTELFRAELLLKQGNFKKSILAFEKVIKNSKNQKVINEAQSNLITTFLSNGEPQKAEKLVVLIMAERPNYLRGYIDASNLYIKLGDIEKAKVTLGIAYEKIDSKTNPVDIQEIAFQLFNFGVYENAIKALEIITEHDIYTDLSRTLLQAYYNNGQKDKALDICRILTESNGPIDVVTEIQCAIYESIGDLTNAILVCENYLEIYPGDNRLQIRLAIIYSRINQLEKVKNLINEITDYSNLSLQASFYLAYLNAVAGNTFKALAIAFTTRRKHINEPEAHLKYIGLLTEFNGLTDSVGTFETIKENTTVKIKDETGGIKTYNILREEDCIQPNDLSINDDLTKYLLGKKESEYVTINKDFGDPMQIQVTSILSKYRYAFQESMELLNTKFVNTSGFRVFKSKETGDFKKDFSSIFENLDKLENFNNQLKDYYHKRVLTIGGYANLQNQNIVKVWSTVINKRADLGVYSLGTSAENFQVVFNNLNKEYSIVVDLVSLLSINNLEKLDILERITNKIIVAQSTVETINELIRELQGPLLEGYMILGKEQGSYVRHEFTSEMIQQNLKYYKKLIKWTEKQCEVLPCNEALKIKSDQKEEIDNLIGKPFIDSILIAKENNFLLLSDEESIRVIARNEYQVNTLPTYRLFQHCYSSGLLKKDDFTELVAKLIDMNYKNLPVTSDVLMKTAEMAGYKYAHPFELAIKTLDYKISLEESSVIVAADFFRLLYLNVSIPQIRINIILSVIKVLIEGRNIDSVMKKLSSYIESRFRYLPAQKEELINTIFDFIKSVAK